MACVEFVHVQDDLGVCSSKNVAEIWNTTSLSRLVIFRADSRTVNPVVLILTAGVTPLVRYPMGASCWDSVPESTAVSVVEGWDESASDDHVLCDFYPRHSPSFGGEVLYHLDVAGYVDCSLIGVRYEASMEFCKQLRAEEVTLASVSYISCVLIGVFLLFRIAIVRLVI